jgi:DNA (cytosine-5)-methyltransferase 1
MRSNDMAATTTAKTKARDIRSLRLASRMPFRTLARQAGVSETDLRKAERGLDLPGNGFLGRVARALGVTEDSLRRAQRSLERSVTPGEGYLTARPDGSFLRRRATDPRPGLVPVLDLFCGTGGFSHGFEQTGHFQVVGGVDLLKDRVETFVANHPTASAACQDIATVSLDELLDGAPSPEVIVGGPPCQGFSSLRPFRALTEKDPRNNLFEQFALTVGALRPAWFVLENVVGILTNQQGKTLQGILSVFGDLRYRLSWRVVNGAYYGLPQRRERFVLVGSRDGEDFAWPEPTHYFEGARSMAGRHAQHHEVLPLWRGSSMRPANTVMDAIHDLPPVASGEAERRYRRVNPTEYERQMRGDCEDLTLHEATRHSAKMLEIIRHAGHNKYALPEGMVTSGFSSSYSRLAPDLPSVTLTVNFVHPASNKCIHPEQDRALTPREGARLQGFPDSFAFVGTRAQVVKQIGNAVPPLLGRVIAGALARHVT